MLLAIFLTLAVLIALTAFVERRASRRFDLLELHINALRAEFREAKERRELAKAGRELLRDRLAQRAKHG